MVSSCSAYGCTNRNTFGRKILFHRFPFRDPELLMKWVIAVRRQNWWPTQYSCICSDHFTDDDYKCKEKSSLKREAVPSIFNFSPPKKKEKKYKRSTNQSVEKYKRKKFKPVKDTSTADGNRDSVSNEPVVIFLSDVHSDSANDVSLDAKNSKTKNFILNENDMIDFMLNATSHESVPDTSDDSVKSKSFNQQIKNSGARNNSVRDISLPVSPTIEQTMSADDDDDETDSADSDENYVDDASIPGTSDDLITDTAVHMKKSTRSSHLIKDKTDLRSNSVCDVSISRVSNDSAVKNVSDSRYEISDSNSSCDTMDKVPLVISISGICSIPKSDISVSVKQLAEKIVVTGKNATTDLNTNPTDDASGTGQNASLMNKSKPEALSAKRGARLNSASDSSLPGNSNDSPSEIPLVITISGICISDLNAMSDVSVSVKQLLERTNSDINKKSSFKLKSVHDRIISGICSDSMTDDSR